MVGPFILMYHSISDNSDDPFSVSVSGFEEQMAWLSENGYEIVSLSYLIKSLKAGSYRKLAKKVVITFDDGYGDFITNAMPILLNYGATATVFLVTDMLGGKASWIKSGEQPRLMTEDEVRLIKSKGISIGSHTATHENLPLLSVEQLKRQVIDSYYMLTNLGESFYSFAYPWGQYSSIAVKTLKDSGFECAVTVGQHHKLSKSNMFTLPRVTMFLKMDISFFKKLMTRTNAELFLRRFYALIFK